MNTNLIAKVGTYNLQVTGAVSTYKSAVVTFTVTITNNCGSTTLTASTLAA